MVRYIFAAFVMVLIGVRSAPAAGPAAAPDVPIFWDAGERLPKPDLSTLERLRFLTTTDFPPFNFLDKSGRLSGFHVDLARAICSELDIADKCQIQAMPWDELDAALEAKEGEAIIAGLAVTAHSRVKYAFSRPYLQFPARFIVQQSSSLAEPIFDALQGKRVGVVAGSAHERMLHDEFGKAEPIAFSKPGDIYDALKSGKIDAAFGDGMRFSFWLAGPGPAGCCRFAGGPYLAPGYLGTGMAIAVPSDDPSLAAAFDYALQQISTEGTFAELYLRYFPVSFY